MALTKTRTSLWSAHTLTAGGGTDNTAWVDLTGSYGAWINCTVTNGASGPTVESIVQVQVADDYNAGTPTLVTNLGSPRHGQTVANAVAYFSWEIKPGYGAVRLSATPGTISNTTANADICTITAI